MKQPADLSPAKRALLERWSRGEGSAPPRVISPRPPDLPHRLSFSQHRQLFLELLEPGTAVNNLSICLELSGALDASALEASVARILDRHETLRTQFVMDGGIPRPEVLDSVVARLPAYDLRQFPAADRLDEALRLARDDALEPIDLGRAPLLRTTLYRLGGDRHVLFVVVHHTIADGWSLDVFLGELLTFYRGISTGASIDLPPLEIQYSDYAHWQRERIAGRDLAADIDYWKERLEGAPSYLDLPVDHSRGARQTFAGATVHFRLDREVVAAVRSLAARSHASLFMVLCAVFDILLHRYTGEVDISIGTPVAGRDRPELQPLIGSFINTLVLRADLDGDPTFSELLRQVRATALGAYSHQDLPFERLVVEMKPDRDLARTPLFQVMLNLQSSSFSALDRSGLSVRPLPLDRATSQFDLTFILSEDDGEILGSAEYNADLFEAATIERMTASFVRLLRQAVERPESRISRLRVLGVDDETRLVVDRNRTEREYPRDAHVHELVQAQVARTPERIALLFDGLTMTYDELGTRLDEVAVHLHRLGVGAGDRVGVRIERSADMVPVLLGVMKSGAAYVPVQPADPLRRVERLLSEARVDVLITSPSVSHPASEPYRVVRLDEIGDQAPGVLPGVGVPQSDPGRSPAYVMYTSGSTGHPKGVEVPHRALVNFLCSMAEAPGIQADDVLLAVTSLSFDISALELYLPLLVGAKVVLACDAMRQDPFALADAIDEYGVTVMQATPATWRMLVDSGWRGNPGLRCLCGGERLDPALATALLERVQTLWNLYGPTETTVWSSACRILAADDVATVGDPIANTRLYVLDDQLNLTPPGVRGELCIGGDGLALGYLNRPDLTTDRFPPDPFRSQAGQRIYRTGDTATYLSDGRIALHGRRDNQVKIQGFRVELGEVESVLSGHSDIRQTVVTAAGHDGRRRLVAYFVPERSPPPAPDELRAFLAERLPSYMLPVGYVPLDSLPLNNRGKIDREALPEPDGNRPALAEKFVAPRSDLERDLAAVYKQVLGLDRVGIHDNFFDIGGGSLQILEIIMAAQDFDVTLSPELLFLHQTVAELASALSDPESGVGAHTI